MSSYAAAFIHYGDPTLTTSAVRQVLGQSLPPAKVVLVDNQGMGERVWDEVVALGVEVVVPGSNRGYAGGANASLDWFVSLASEVGALWILNADVVLRQDAGEKLMAAADSLGPEAWDVLGSLVSQDGRLWFGGGRFSPMSGRASHENVGVPLAEAGADGSVHPTHWINGCSLVVSRAVAASGRRMDEHLFLYKEELAWQVAAPALRAFLLRDVLVEHDAGGVTGGTATGLGRLFMSRNTWILAMQRTGLARLVSLFFWAREFFLKPVVKREWKSLRTGLLGVKLRHIPGAEIVEDHVRR